MSVLDSGVLSTPPYYACFRTRSQQSSEQGRYKMYSVPGKEHLMGRNPCSEHVVFPSNAKETLQAILSQGDASFTRRIREVASLPLKDVVTKYPACSHAISGNLNVEKESSNLAQTVIHSGESDCLETFNTGPLPSIKGKSASDRPFGVSVSKEK